MKYWIAPIAIALMASFLVVSGVAQPEDEPAPTPPGQPAPSKDPDTSSQPDMPSQQEMMARMAEAAKTGPEHEKLKYFIGKWNVAVDVMGTTSKATAVIEWVIPGRWIGHRVVGTYMGKTAVVYSIHGYDRYARAYVTTSISSVDTAMNVVRGPNVDPTGKSIVQYGFLQEYITGDLYKPYKTVTTTTDDDHFSIEVWDLGMGVEGGKVITYAYSRVK